LFANFLLTYGYEHAYNLNVDQRRMKKDGKYPIIFRLTHNRKTTSISTGYSILEIHWDEKKKEVMTSYKKVESVRLLNIILL